MFNQRPTIILASGSPRRRELLRNHLKLKVMVPKTSERQRQGERPTRYVVRVALEKWRAARAQFSLESYNQLMVSADTIVEIDGRILGKPRHQKECKRMMKLLSGRTHRVSTAVCVGSTFKKRPQKIFCVHSKVRFRKLRDDELTRYVRDGDWKGKAGGYAIQGDAIHFVDAVSGSLTSIVGLPVNETLQALAQLNARPPS